MVLNTTVTDDGIEIYENEICKALDQYLLEREVKDMEKLPQSKWNAALYYINKKCYSGNNKYKLKLEGSSHNEYDTNKVNAVCDIYINLCLEYDKEISALGFGRMTGISDETISQWGNDVNIGSPRFGIYKKLKQYQEESLKGMLESKGRNPIGVLGILNHLHGWNMPGVHENSQKRLRSAEQIAAERGLEDSDNSPHLGLPNKDF